MPWINPKHKQFEVVLAKFGAETSDLFF